MTIAASIVILILFLFFVNIDIEDQNLGQSNLNLTSNLSVQHSMKTKQLLQSYDR